MGKVLEFTDDPVPCPKEFDKAAEYREPEPKAVSFTEGARTLTFYIPGVFHMEMPKIRKINKFWNDSWYSFNEQDLNFWDEWMDPLNEQLLFLFMKFYQQNQIFGDRFRLQPPKPAKPVRPKKGEGRARMEAYKAAKERYDEAWDEYKTIRDTNKEITAELREAGNTYKAFQKKYQVISGFYQDAVYRREHHGEKRQSQDTQED